MQATRTGVHQARAQCVRAGEIRPAPGESPETRAPLRRTLGAIDAHHSTELGGMARASYLANGASPRVRFFMLACLGFDTIDSGDAFAQRVPALHLPRV
jgi:hypothetical protein